MQNTIVFSLFGNYEKFSTNNLEQYLKLINFFWERGYKPATVNELLVQPNGQPRVIVMPLFSNETGAAIELTLNRINFRKNIDGNDSVELLKEEFLNEFSGLMETFVDNMLITANRLAVNCELLKENVTSEMPTLSEYFDGANRTEMSVRNVARKMVENEESNIIIEKYVAVQGGFTKYTYDINSIGENQTPRFNSGNTMNMFEAYMAIVFEIEKGLK